jgi:hypothetical protein
MLTVPSMTYVKRTLQELVNREEPAWPLVQEWLSEATHPVELLPPAEDAGDSLVSIQVTTRSPLGAVVLHTGGFLVDHGWLRVLGSGHPRLPRSLPKWNFACGMAEALAPPPCLLVADDVLGGFFALNGGKFSPEGRTVWYLAPDTLEWEDTENGYTDFLRWCFSGDLELFYKSYRWRRWKSDTKRLAGDQAFSIVPPLSTEEDLPIEKRSRGVVPLDELFRLHVGTL